MVAPDCSRCSPALSTVRKLTADSRAIRDLQRYLTSYRGAQFDRLTDRETPDEFTSKDFRAVRRLSVSVLLTAQAALRERSLRDVRRLLGTIPRDLDIWDVPPGKFDAVLGPQSQAWQLWQLLFDLQKGARSSEHVRWSSSSDGHTVD